VIITLIYLLGVFTQDGIEVRSHGSPLRDFECGIHVVLFDDVKEIFQFHIVLPEVYEDFIKLS
jgi:hypothetical protein